MRGLYFPERVLSEINDSYSILGYLLVFGATAPQWTRPPSFTKFLEHTQRRATIGRSPLDE